MKKRITSLFALCILLALALTSCSLDQAMDLLSGNKWIELGWAEVDTSAADSASEAVDNMQKADASSAVTTDGGKTTLNVSDIDGFETVTEALGSVLGDSITIDLTDNTALAERIQNNGVLKPQTTPEKNALNASISQALAGSANRDSFVSQMKETAGEEQSNAAKNSMAVTSQIITQIRDHYTPEAGGQEPINETAQQLLSTLDDLNSQLQEKSQSTDNLSKAEVLQVQMITNMVTSIASVASDTTIQDTAQSNPAALLTNPNVEALINDASLLSSASKALSGDTDVITVPGLTDLINSMMNSASEEEPEPAPAPQNLRLARAVLLNETDTEEEEDDGKLHKDTINGIDVYRIPGAYDSTDMTTEDEEIMRDSIQFAKNFLEDALGYRITSNGSNYSESEFRMRQRAYSNYVSANDALFSLVTLGYSHDPDGNVTGITLDGDWSLLEEYTSPGKAVDYALAVLMSALQYALDIAETDTDSFLLNEVLDDIVTANDWIGRGDLEDGDYAYLPADIVEAVVGTDVNNVDGEEVYKRFLSDEVQTWILSKAETLDKMMAVGSFDLNSIASLFQIDETTDVVSIKDLVQDAFDEMNKNQTESGSNE